MKRRLILIFTHLLICIFIGYPFIPNVPFAEPAMLFNEPELAVFISLPVIGPVRSALLDILYYFNPELAKQSRDNLLNRQRKIIKRINEYDKSTDIDGQRSSSAILKR